MAGRGRLGGCNRRAVGRQVRPLDKTALLGLLPVGATPSDRKGDRLRVEKRPVFGQEGVTPLAKRSMGCHAAEMSPARALTIAGSDSGGGAGIQADLKTFQELDCFGTSVITALTAQNTLGVQAVHEAPPEFVREQLDSVLGDIGTDAAKIGMLGSASVVAAVAAALRAHRVERLIVDPVCISKHGDPLLQDDALEGLRAEILPLAELVTPNLDEVRLLTGVDVRGLDDLRAAAEAMHALGSRWVLIKGGHLPDNEDAVDLLFDGTDATPLGTRRLDTRDTHGTGCTLSAAIAAFRARGVAMEEAVRRAKDYVTGAIAGGLRLGGGIGPLDHGWARR